ncbi:zonular occludens toxin domain-containing protein [Brevibacillus agri]|uniref:zonular occludens toxin domain-containing protein n=1 Tax=Brevibacillus agri TaxID=51101 RepID=UPI002E215CAC|nr:zonular occludens toxin domain-containing protein [Brevibacillus agri]
MPHFIGVQGYLGAGKTTVASVLAHLMRNKVRQKGGDIKLFSNYGLRGSQRMASYADWYSVADVHGSIILWDEAQEQFDGREFSSAERAFSTRLLNYCRKMASVQIMIAPNYANLDNRIRQLTEVLINVSSLGKKGIRMEFYDYTAGNKQTNLGRFLHSQFLPARNVKRVHALNLFRTHRLVSGFPMPKTPREQETFYAKLEEVHNNALIRLGIPVDDDESDVDIDFWFAGDEEQENEIA